jgi:hypothetical protein
MMYGPNQLARLAGRAASLAIACGVLLLTAAGLGAALVAYLAALNLRLMRPVHLMAALAVVVVSLAPGVVYVALASHVRRLRFWATACVLALASMQSLAALAVVVWVAYFSATFPVMLLLLALAWFVLGARLVLDLSRVITQLGGGRGRDHPAFAVSSPEGPVPVLQHIHGKQQVGDGMRDDARP